MKNLEIPEECSFVQNSRRLLKTAGVMAESRLNKDITSNPPVAGLACTLRAARAGGTQTAARADGTQTAARAGGTQTAAIELTADAVTPTLFSAITFYVFI